jgi:hypothetical protein
MSQMLPPGFETLEPFAATWAVASAAARAQRRSSSSAEERSAFYQAAKELLAPALAVLDRKPLKAFDDQERRLMNLMLCFAHVAQAVEVQRDGEASHAQLRASLTITRASADSS